MRTRLIGVVMLFVVIAPATTRACNGEFSFSVSSSGAYPFANYLAATPDDPFNLYLWLVCDEDGMPLLAFEAEVISDLTLGQFVPNADVLYSGTPQHPSLGVVGCPEAPFLLGWWVVSNPAALTNGEFCLETGYGDPPPSAVAGDCVCLGIGIDFLAGVRGFAFGGATVCSADNGCEIPVSVEPLSWGRLKSSYRTPAN